MGTHTLPKARFEPPAVRAIVRERVDRLLDRAWTVPLTVVVAPAGAGKTTAVSHLVTRATEPASVGESHVQEYTCGSRTGVVLRFGLIVGDDALTRFQLRALRHGQPIGLGLPEGWAHLLHTDDLGPAVLAALIDHGRAREKVPGRRSVLLERGECQPGVHQRCNDLGEAVVERDRLG